MFEAHLDSSSTFKKLIESIKGLIPEANLECTSEGLSIRTMDKGHLAFLVLHLPAQNFDEYACDSPFKLGVSLESFSKFLKIGKDQDKLTLKASEEAEAMTIVFWDNKGTKTTELNMNLRVLDHDSLGIPETEYTAQMEFPSYEFHKICRDLQPITDTLKIYVKKGSVKFELIDEMAAGETVLMPVDSEKFTERVLVKTNHDLEMAFSVKYLTLINRCSSLSDQVCIWMSQDIPIKIQYKFELGEVSYFLAPKIPE
mmetsp:Transcript_8408/g.12414  ORF Transcript_8408/g.12414 Transcript_8408/m.12414 type:complete len:256 (-) Transcript_8408:27-794(-)